MQSILRSCLTEILHLCADFSQLWQSLNILTALAIYVSPSFSISLYIEVDVGHIWHCLRDKFVACRLTYIIPIISAPVAAPLFLSLLIQLTAKEQPTCRYSLHNTHTHTYLHGYPYSAKNVQQANWVNANARDWPRQGGGGVYGGVFALVWSSSGCTKRLSRSYLTSRHNDD